MERQHQYRMDLEWCGNTGSGTATYRSYKRDHLLFTEGKTPIACSSDPAFRGDATRYNPEELLVAALAGCHMLWFLHLAADSGITVTEYRDHAEGTMMETAEGGGRFTDVCLKPTVVVKTGADPQLCFRLHERAHDLCFIANSVNFPVRCEPSTLFE